MSTRTREAPDAAGVILTFLESIGRRSEAELYLKLFRELPKESFAIIAVDSAVIRYAKGSLVEQLRFLRELGLFAPVAVGLFDPTVAEKAAQRLSKRCADMGAVIESARDPDIAAQVRAELAEENLPLLCFSPLPDVQEPVAARFEQLGRIAGALGTRKIVLLRRRGGLGRASRTQVTAGDPAGGSERGISVVNLRTDLARLREPRVLPSEDLELLELAHGLLTRPDCASAVVSITSPLNLLRELFTVKGAGTLVKRGSAIERHDAYESLDIGRLEALLESSFGRKVSRQFFEKPPLAAYVEENYRGAAIISAAPIAPYLTKFAVDRVAQGEGLGRDLWEALAQDFPALYWRARTENPIASWYATLADGLMRTGAWTVYFRGIEPAKVPLVVEDALARSDDFAPD